MTCEASSSPWFLSVSVVAVIIVIAAAGAARNAQESDPAYWVRIGQDELSRALNAQPIRKRAKNIILFVADGMSVTTVTAARIYQGQKLNKTGEEGLLFFERFPNFAHAKTYTVNMQTPDSAATATAFLCGVKTNSGTIGVDPTVTRKNCSAQAGHELTSILHWSQQAGKHVGVVTNTRITHATPAAAYAHSAERMWEGDSKMTDVKGGCKDIARQLVEDNADIRVIMGGGRYFFLPNTEPDPESGRMDVNKRLDGKNLVQDWLDEKAVRNAKASYVWNATSFYQVDPDNTDFLLGLFEDSHMDYDLLRTSQPDPEQGEAGEPSLAEMTATAVRMLSKSEQGFFLMVEGGRIDHAHHSNFGKLSLADTIAFDEAVRAATEMTSPEETLIVVTSDHSHTVVMSGYPSRGNSITGVVDMNLAKDGLSYTTLLYGNGPGYVHENGMRADVMKDDVEDPYYRYQAAVPLKAETHSGEDVPVYAQGPMGYLFHATHEQNYIAYVMAFASCVGLYANESDCAAALSDSFPSADRPTSAEPRRPVVSSSSSSADSADDTRVGASGSRDDDVSPDKGSVLCVRNSSVKVRIPAAGVFLFSCAVFVRLFIFKWR